MADSKTKEFNRIAKELCIDISRKYDSFADTCEETIENIDENGENEGSFYMEYYVNNVLPHIEVIAKCDEEGCFRDKVCILDDVSLKHIFNSGITVHNKQIIWKYLHTLYVLFQSIPNVRETYPQSVKYLDMKDVIVKEIVKSRKRLTEEIEAEKKELEENVKKMEDKVKESFGDDMMNSSIGNLAKEISEEIDLKDLESMENPAELFGALFSGGKGGDNDKINNLFGKVGDKLSTKMKNGEIDEQKLFSEATNMMSGLGGLFGQMGGEKGGSAGGMPDLSKMMSSLGGLSGMANMMGGGMNSRKMRRKMDKKMKKSEKKHGNSSSKSKKPPSSSSE